MRSSANIGGHPIHPMLVPLPIGLWVFSFVARQSGLGNGGVLHAGERMRRRGTCRRRLD